MTIGKPGAFIMGDKLRRIRAAGEKLAAQLGGVFVIDPAKMSDFQRREAALSLLRGDGK